MANAKSNLPKVSFDKKGLPSGKGPENQYTSSRVLSKASSSTDRPAKYKLENKKC